MASEGRFRRQFRGSGIARGLRTLISSTVSRIWSSARPRNLDFVNNFEDLEAPQTGKTRGPQVRPTRKAINLPRDGLVLLYLSAYLFYLFYRSIYLSIDLLPVAELIIQNIGSAGAMDLVGMLVSMDACQKRLTCQDGPKHGSAEASDE